MTNEPIWVRKEAVILIHRSLLDRFGGLVGLRDEGQLDSALARPKNLWLYSPAISVPDLASRFAIGLVQNHPFMDGNKSASLVVSVLFLELNGFKFSASEVEAATMFWNLAAGDTEDTELIDWFRLHTNPDLSTS